MLYRCDGVSSALSNVTAFITAEPSGQRYAVVLAPSPTSNLLPVVMDADAVLAGRTLRINTQGYAYSCSSVSHHCSIVGQVPPGCSVDHIDRIKTDNRRANLRVASITDQATNRFARVDKRPPPPELVALGIARMPCAMRWDASEGKFSAEVFGHGQVNGSKSERVSLVNKFRDCVQRVINVLQNLRPEDAAFAERRMALAREYNAIVRAAHVACPESFPDGPYADVDDLMDDVQYCRRCLDKLPPVGAGEVLHGSLNVVSHVRDLPEIDAVALIKPVTIGGVPSVRVMLFDARFKELIARLPACDVASGASPTLPGTMPLHEQYPGVVSSDDVRTKRKFMLKDIVWTAWLGREKPEGHTVVPLNYQQCDLRAANLLLLPGGAKEHKGIEEIPAVPRELGLAADIRFWPRDVYFNMSERAVTSPWTFIVRGPQKTKKTFTCSSKTVAETFEKVVAVLRDRDVEHDATYSLYQRLLGEYLAVAREV
jgi:hypothetical protein